MRIRPTLLGAITTTVIAVLALIPSAPASAQTIPWGLTRENLVGFQPRSARQASEQLRQLADELSRNTPARTPRPFARAGVPASARWTDLGPPSRERHSLVVDTRRDRYLVAGGNLFHPRFGVWSAAAGSPATWSYLGGANGAPASSPEAACLAVYDSLHDRVILCESSFDQPPHLYELSLSQPSIWHPIAATNAPDPGSGVTAIAWDEEGQQLFAMKPIPAGLWRFDVATGAWDSLPAPGPPTPGDFPAPLVFDSRSRSVVYGSSRLLLDGDPHWVPLGAPPISVGRTEAALYDRASDRLLAIQRGGSELPYGDAVFAWRYGEAAWTALGPANGSLERAEGAAYAFDPMRNEVLRSGGVGFPSGEARSSLERLPLGSPAEWIDVGPYSGGARMWHSAVVDESRDRMLVYGGWLATLPSITVIARPLDGSDVQPVTPAAGPQPRSRFGQAIAYDSIRDRLLLFGGLASDGTGDNLGDLWALDFTSDPPRWEQQPELPGGPGALRFASMFFDGPRDRLVVFGGHDGAGYPAGVRALKFGTTPHWISLATTGDGDGSYVGNTFFDAERSRAWAVPSYGDVIRMDFGDDDVHFTALPVTGSEGTPLAFVAYDPRTSRCVGYEVGSMGVHRTDAVWTLQLGDSPTARPEPAVGEGPWRNRFLDATVFDTRRSRMVLYGGYDNSDRYYDDWFALTFDRPVPVLATLVGADVTADRVRLEWRLGENGGPVRIERSCSGEAWAERAQVTPDGESRVLWTDRDIVPGGRYAYRLRLAGGEMTAEVPVQVPEALRALVLAPERTPTEGALAVRFTLPRAGDASIDLYDVTGRRLRTQRFVSLEPGEHRASLLAPGEAPAGLYWIRLASGGLAATARAVIAR